MTPGPSHERHAISRLAAVAVSCLLVLVAAVGYLALSPRQSTSSTTTTSSSATTTTATTTSTTPPASTTTTSSSTHPEPEPANSSQLTDDSLPYSYDSLDPAVGFFPSDGYFADVFQGIVQYNGSDSLHVVPPSLRAGQFRPTTRPGRSLSGPASLSPTATPSTHTPGGSAFREGTF